MRVQGRAYLWVTLGTVGLLAVAGSLSDAAGWEPTKPIEFIVPAGTGGGADQMARLIRWLD